MRKLYLFRLTSDYYNELRFLCDDEAKNLLDLGEIGLFIEFPTIITKEFLNHILSEPKFYIDIYDLIDAIIRLFSNKCINFSYSEVIIEDNLLDIFLKRYSVLNAQHDKHLYIIERHLIFLLKQWLETNNRSSVEKQKLIIPYDLVTHSRDTLCCFPLFFEMEQFENDKNVEFFIYDFPIKNKKFFYNIAFMRNDFEITNIIMFLITFFNVDCFTNLKSINTKLIELQKEIDHIIVGYSNLNLKQKISDFLLELRKEFKKDKTINFHSVNFSELNFILKNLYLKEEDKKYIRWKKRVLKKIILEK